VAVCVSKAGGVELVFAKPPPAKVEVSGGKEKSRRKEGNR